MREEFEEQKKELRKKDLWISDKQPMRFTYGNTCLKTENNHGSFGWTMFVVLHNDRMKTSNYIKSVTYRISDEESVRCNGEQEVSKV